MTVADQPTTPPATGTDPLMALVLVAAAAFGVAWLGAQLACLAASGHLLGVGLDDVARSLLRTPSTWSDPSAAWPEPARSRLPGPAGYWTATVAVAAAGVMSA